MKIYYIIGVVNDLVIRIYDYSLFGGLYILNDIDGLKLSSVFFQSVTNVTKSGTDQNNMSLTAEFPTLYI